MELNSSAALRIRKCGETSELGFNLGVLRPHQLRLRGQPFSVMWSLDDDLADMASAASTCDARRGPATQEGQLCSYILSLCQLGAGVADHLVFISQPETPCNAAECEWKP